MFQPNPKDFQLKIDRIRTYLEENRYSGMLLCRRDNFSWLTSGGDSAIIETTEYGFCILVVTEKKTYLVAQTMDARWLMDLMLEGCPVEPVILRWDGPGREEKALELAGPNPAADRELPGCAYRFKDILKLHYPLLPREIAMYREWGKIYEKTLAKIVSQVTPDMTELAVKELAVAEFAKEEAYAAIFLVGSGEGLEKYRHPVPWDSPLGKVVLIHPGMRRYGQHYLVTRMFCFGEVPEKLRRDYDFLNLLQAHTLSMCRPGVRLGDIIESRRQLVFEMGYEKEWGLHYPGGITEYHVATPQWGLDNEPILETMCLDWYLTVTGAKVEELAMIQKDGPELLSVNGFWPVKEYTYNGQTFCLPDLLVK